MAEPSSTDPAYSHYVVGVIPILTIFFTRKWGIPNFPPLRHVPKRQDSGMQASVAVDPPQGLRTRLGPLRRSVYLASNFLVILMATSRAASRR